MEIVNNVVGWLGFLLGVAVWIFEIHRHRVEQREKQAERARMEPSVAFKFGIHQDVSGWWVSVSVTNTSGVDIRRLKVSMEIDPVTITLTPKSGGPPRTMQARRSEDLRPWKLDDPLEPHQQAKFLIHRAEAEFLVAAGQAQSRVTLIVASGDRIIARTARAEEALLLATCQQMKDHADNTIPVERVISQSREASTAAPPAADPVASAPPAQPARP